MSTPHWALPPRGMLGLRWALALSGWAAVAAVGTLPDAATLRVLVATVFLVLCPGLAAARWSGPSPFRAAGRAFVLETALLAVVLSMVLAVLVAVPFFLSGAFTAIRVLIILAALTSALTLLPLPRALRPGAHWSARRPPAPGAAEEQDKAPAPMPHRGPATAARPKPAGRVPVAVLGAGPYGLATAAHLDAAGVRLRIFGEPMETWRTRMPDGMFLRTAPSGSAISAPGPGHGPADFRTARDLGPLDDRQPLPLREFTEYGQWFQERRVPGVERSRVRRIERTDGGFALTLATGEEVLAATVVVATGTAPFAHLPRELLHCAEAGLASHSSDHPDLGRFAGQSVAVLGGGESALESAALLHEAGARPTVIARAREVVYEERPGGPLGSGRLSRVCGRADTFRLLPPPVRLRLLRSVPGPSAAWWLRDRADGAFPVLTRCRVRVAVPQDGAVRLELTGPDGGTRTLLADHVLLATGYRVDVNRLPFLEPALRQSLRTFGGAPRLSSGFESSVPGLHFTGLAAAPTFGPLLKFVAGTGFAAPRVAAAVAARNRG